jgi:hypothetical protein
MDVMLGMRLVRRAMVSLLLLGGGVLTAQVPPALAAATPTISSVQEIGGKLTGLACPSTTQCAAVNEFARELTFDPVAPLTPPTSARITPETNSESVACPSTTQCTAVGWLNAEVTFDPAAPGVPVSEAPMVNPLWAVSCPSTTQCTAVGGREEDGQEVTFDPGAPGTPMPVALGSAAGMGVACPSTTQCTAVTSQGEEVTFDPTSPSGASPVVIDPNTSTWDADPQRVSLGGVACPSTTQCTSVGFEGLVLTFDPIAPADPISAQLSGPQALARHQISCPATTQCTVIAEESAVETTFDPDAPGDPTAYEINAPTGVSSSKDIACPSTTQCTIITAGAAGGQQITFALAESPPAAPSSPAPSNSLSPSPLSETPASEPSPPPPATSTSPPAGSQTLPLESSRFRRWTSAQCARAYKSWSTKHRSATRQRKDVEMSTLHHEHACRLISAGAAATKSRR